MKNWFNTLNEREKWILAGGLFFLVLYLWYALVYNPLNTQVTLQSTRLTEKTATLEWMKQTAVHYHAHKTTQKLDNSQLLTVLATQLKNDTIMKFPYQLQQTGSGDIQLTFESVPFNLFMGWLQKVSEHYAITIKQFEAERGKTSGVVRLLLLVNASG